MFKVGDKVKIRKDNRKNYVDWFSSSKLTIEKISGKFNEAYFVSSNQCPSHIKNNMFGIGLEEIEKLQPEYIEEDE